MHQVALRFSERFVVVGYLKRLARIDTAISIENVAPILLHSRSYLVVLQNRDKRGRVLGLQCLEVRGFRHPPNGGNLLGRCERRL